MYNILERTIHAKLSSRPRLKMFVKLVYQLPFVICKIFLRRTFEIRGDFSIPNAFIGFHDVKFSNRNGIIAVHSTTSRTRARISDTDFVGIDLYDPAESKKMRIGESSAFNWQMGSRLQWLNEEEVCWNEIHDGKLIAKIFDYSNGNYKKFSYPVYSLSATCGIYASVSFQNIERNMAGYGYVGTYKEKVDADEVAIVSLESGKLLNKLKIFNINDHPFVENRRFISHLRFSDSGKYLALFVRSRSFKYEFETTLNVVEHESGEIFATLNDFSVVTHYTWANENIIFFGLKDGKFQYWIWNISLNHVEQFSLLSGFPDGHPSFLENVLVTDTYPDRSRVQYLYTADMDDEIVHEIGRHSLPFKFTGYSRIDLHPRISERFIAVDVGLRDGSKVVIFNRTAVD